jgi:hypothetical protein
MSDQPLDRIAPSLLPALRQQLADLRHDLGKYVAFQLRWLPPEPSDAELREALAADLGRTRAAGGEVESAPLLWARLRPALVGACALDGGGEVDLRDDPDLIAIDAAISLIAELLPVLQEADRAQLEAGRRAALGVSDATKRLLSRARAL